MGLKERLQAALKGFETRLLEDLTRLLEDLELRGLLAKAKKSEREKKFKHAVGFYLEYLEKWLDVWKRRGLAFSAYVRLAPCYERVAQCYEQIQHIRIDEMVRDCKCAATYWEKAAGMYLEAGNVKKAHACLERAAEVYLRINDKLSAAKTYSELANVYLNQGENLLALELLLKAADVQEESGDLRGAAETLNKALSVSQSLGEEIGIVKVYERLAKCYERLGEHEEAMRYYAPIMMREEGAPKYVDVLIEVAKGHEASGRMDEAYRCYKEAAELVADSDELRAATCLRSAANCCKVRREYEKAIELLKKAVEFYAKREKLEEAALCKEEIASCWKEFGNIEKFAEIMAEAAETYRSLKDLRSIDCLKTSLKAYEQLLGVERDPWRVAVLRRRAARCLEGLGDHKGAASYYKQAALAFEEVGSCVEAKECYRMAAKSYERAELLWEAASCYERAQSYEQARDLYLKLAEGSGRAGDHFTAGKATKLAATCCQRIRGLQAATALYAKAIQHFSLQLEKSLIKRSKGEVEFEIGECYRKLGNLRNAKEAYRKAAEGFGEEGAEEKRVCEAFASWADATLALQRGDYEAAAELASKSLEILESHKASFISVEEVEELKKGCRSILEEAKRRPELLVEVPSRLLALRGEPLIVPLKLSNVGEVNIRRVLLFSNFPSSFERRVEPRVPQSLAKGSSCETVVEVLPKQCGIFEFEPLEALYEDEAGKRFIKASEKLRIEVLETLNVEQLRNYSLLHASAGNPFQVAKGFLKLAKLSPSREGAAEALKSFQESLSWLGRRFCGYERLERLAEVFRGIGECYEILKAREQASRWFGKASKLYRRLARVAEAPKVREQFEALACFTALLSKRLEALVSGDERADKARVEFVQGARKLLRSGTLPEVERKLLEALLEEC